MIRLSFLAAVLLALVLPANAQNQGILTVSGTVTKTNYGAVTEDDGGLFAHYGIFFDKGFQFDRTTLAALPQKSYAEKSSAGNVTVSGPLLADVVAHAGGEGSSFTLTGLDGYQVTLDTAYMNEHSPIVAIEANGVPLDVGRFGPAKIAFQHTDDATLAQDLSFHAVWGLFHIDVSDE